MLYNLGDLTLDDINDELSRGVVSILNGLEDISVNLVRYVDRDKMNQIFLFRVDSIVEGEEIIDLSSVSNRGLGYGLNVQQWNPRIETIEDERKHVKRNYLIDLYGEEGAMELENYDVITNMVELENDIIDIFENRGAEEQRKKVSVSKHGYFVHNGSLRTIDHNKIRDSVSYDNDSLTRQLLKSAELGKKDNKYNKILKRQFDSTNTSNEDYGLPVGWRTFQFVEGDTLSYNLKIKQGNDNFPTWSKNQSALVGGSLGSMYRVKLIIQDDPSGEVAELGIPPLDMNVVSSLNNSDDLNSIIVNNIGESNINDITVNANIISDNINREIRLGIELNIENVDYNSISEVNKNIIKDEIKVLYADRLNINAVTMKVTLTE